MMIPASKDKWHKYSFMHKSNTLAPHLPETYNLTFGSFWNLMSKYGRVIVKPTGGSRGRNVFQVTDLGNGLFEIHIEDNIIRLLGRERTYDYLQRNIGSDSFIVQRWVNRATVGESPFDVRIIVQRRTNSSKWIVTGKVAKVAGKGFIVSNNTRSKGDLLFVETAIERSSIRNLSPKTLLARLDRAALLSAKRLSVLFPDHRIYGFDMGLDQNGQVWIIEANLFPARSHFRKLKDHRMLRRITAFKRS